MNLVVPFFHYHDTSKEACKKLFDMFYFFACKLPLEELIVIDSGDFIPESDNYLVAKYPRQSHWDNLNDFFYHNDLDKFLLVDSDTMIYKPEVIDYISGSLEKADIVSIMDNSGGLPLEQQFEWLQPNEDRAVRRRFAPYLFASLGEFFVENDSLDFTPTTGEYWTDSMGTVTAELIASGLGTIELPDDRTTVFYNNGDIKVDQWLDGPGYKWSEVVNPDYGYYHLRNMGTGIYAVECFKNDRDKWNHIKQITPLNELLRILTWTNYFLPLPENMISELGLTKVQYDKYIEVFESTYTWLK